MMGNLLTFGCTISKYLYSQSKYFYLMVRFYTYIEQFLEDLNKQISLSEFERYYKKPHQTLKNHLQKLVEKKILAVEKKTRFTFYKINKRNPLLKEYLTMCERERLFTYLEKNTLIKRLYDLLSSYMNNHKLLIFGSAVAKKEFSDIDLLIISDNKDIRKKINEFVKTYDVKIHVIQTDEKNITETFIEEIRKKHIIFNDFEYFIRLLYKDELKLV